MDRSEIVFDLCEIIYVMNVFVHNVFVYTNLYIHSYFENINKIAEII